MLELTITITSARDPPITTTVTTRPKRLTTRFKILQSSRNKPPQVWRRFNLHRSFTLQAATPKLRKLIRVPKYNKLRTVVNKAKIKTPNLLPKMRSSYLSDRKIRLNLRNPVNH